MKRRVKFSFPTHLVQEPIIFQLGKDYNVVTNIRRAEVTDVQGWVVMELEGNDDDIDRGLDWVRDRGVRVDPVGGDVVES
ncbi:MAG: NIL domain-containing protein [Chloroflexi bacterium]|nr:NIL domain-containing protein [Chloroflexota bacterium]MCH8284138.1 NIL domain-containing protein [Chloroflexota bacterium]